MNIGNIFWDLPGASSLFRRKLQDLLPGGLTLRLEDPLPFSDALWEGLGRSLGCPVRVLDWGKRNCSPGDFLLRHLFSPRERAYYFPGDPYGGYIASLRAEPAIIRVRGVRGSAAAKEWAELVTGYRRAGGSALRLVIECDACACGASLTYRADPNLHRCFAIMMAGILNNTPMTGYQAELAANLAPRDPELCSELLLQGEQLLLDPLETARALGLDEQQTLSAIRQANLVCLYPKIEQRRFDFIRSNEEAIARCLPLRSMEGELIDNPMDLEVGPLSYLLYHKEALHPLPDGDSIHLCASVRNKIAHNRMVPYATLLALNRL